MNESSTINLTAYTSSDLWVGRGLSMVVIRQLLDGHYGFTPSEVFVNSQLEGKLISRYRAQLEKRLAAGSVELLTATLGGEHTAPRFDLSITNSRNASCIVRIELPYVPAEVTPAFIERILTIAESLSDDTRAEFIRGHDHAGWLELHRERRGHRLFVPGYVDRAYWLTYLCDAYVVRLGGEDSVRRAPAFACKKLTHGMLLQSHADFLDTNRPPRRQELDALQAYLANLVKPEERP